jgi:class 3 adenylate cyclase/tetratricopeptide (TPR) repeat protein
VAATKEQASTILFTDVEGSTQLRSRRGDQLADEILRAHEVIVRRQVQACGGREAAFLGDGFILTFRSVLDGLRCAQGIQRALGEHNRADPDRQVRVRIGLHHGETTEREGAIYGQAVHAAARIMSEAAGGQILASDPVRELGADEAAIGFTDRGLFWLKGFPERWRLYEVGWGEPGSLAPASVAGPARTPFIDRDNERAELRQAVELALGGHGGLVLVCGEAGVGKSRLIQEVNAEAEARGMGILTGHCVHMEGVEPYLPFVEILEQALLSPRSPMALREALGESGSEIARILPSLRRVVPDLPAPLDLPPEQARRYLWISLLEFTERATRDRPTLLVLEDLHWADESTLLLTEYLAAHVQQLAVLIVGTYRDDEVGRAHPLARVVGQLTRRRLGSRIALQRLAEDQVGAMLRGLADDEPPQELVRAIDAETEGNPFFVEEVFLHLVESGVLVDQDGRFRRDLRIDELDVPDSIRLVIGERLGRLSRTTRQVLTAGALLGRVFETAVLEHLSGLEPDALADALEEAEQARLIAPDRADGSRLVFSHELLRQTLLVEESSLRRQRLHAKAAEAIEWAHADDLEAYAADLAYHLARAGPGADRMRLVRYLRVAGDRAVEAAAFQDAVTHFRHAISLLPDGDAAGHGQLLERLALGLRSIGRWDEALEAMNQALTLYERLGQTDALGRLCWTMTENLAWAARWSDAVAAAQRGLAALGDLPNPDRARMQAAIGWILGLSGNYPAASAMLAQGRTLAEQLADDQALADVLHIHTIQHMAYAEFPDGIQDGLHAANVFETHQALWELSSVLSFVGYQAGLLGRLEQAATIARRAGPLAGRLGHLGASFMTLANRIRAEGVLAGDLARVEAIGQEMLEVCDRGHLPWAYVGHIYQGLAAHWRGDWDSAEHELRLALEVEPAGALSGQSAAQLALHLAHAGRPEEALAIIAAGREALPTTGPVNSLGTWNMLLGFTEALYLAGEAEAAAALLPLITQALTMGHEWMAFDGRLIQTRAGIAAAAARRWEQAERHYHAALQLAEALSSRIEQADLRRLYARMLLDRDQPGDRERAQSLLSKATDAYRNIGMPRYEALSSTLIAEAQ